MLGLLTSGLPPELIPPGAAIVAVSLICECQRITHIANRSIRAVMLSNAAARLMLGSRIVEASLPRVVYQCELLTVLDFTLQKPVQGQYLPWRYRRIRLLVLPDSLQAIDRKSLHRWLNLRYQATVIAGKNR